MNSYTTLVASALVVAATTDLSTAKESYLQELPNGSLFAKTLGHTGATYSDFATAFQEEKFKWTPGFCKAMFPGASMTNGAAFGDPCCTFTKGGKPDFVVEPFTDKPAKATECAAGGDATVTKGGDETATKGDDAAQTTEGGNETGGAYSSTPPSTGGDDTATKGGVDTATKGDDAAQTTEGGNETGGADPSTPPSTGGDDTATKGGDDTATKGGDEAQTTPTTETSPVTGGASPSTPPSTGGGCGVKTARKLRQ